jgi:hypothetical protein
MQTGKILLAQPSADIDMPSWRFTKQLPEFPGAVSFCPGAAGLF